MRSFISIGLCSLGLLGVASGAEAGVPVSVLAFKNKTGSMSCNQDWYWWQDHLGSAFQDMLLTELGKDDRLELLERENIQELNDSEVNLVNSENSKHKIEKGHFSKAKYSLVGSVSSYEYCAEKKKLGVGVSAVSGFLGATGLVGAVADTVNEVGVSRANAKIVIDVRVVETKTGRIVKTVRSEGTADRSNFAIDSSLASYEDAQKTPVAEAARMAIEKAVAQLTPTLVGKR